MSKRAIVLLLVVLAFASLQHAHAMGKQVRLRINTTHGLENAKGAVEDAGLQLTTQVSVTPSSRYDGRPFLQPGPFLEDGLRVGATILSSSFGGWNYLLDFTGYRELSRNGVVHVFAYEPTQTQPKNAPPPAAFVTVNAVGRTTGDGIEFGVPTDYMAGKGQSPFPSGVTAQLAGLMACLKYRHPSWNWFDVKAALRSTAGNFHSGYDPRKYGYGIIDYRSANALSEASSLPLFPPAAVIGEIHDDRIDFFVNSFRQTRRVADVLMKFPVPPPVRRMELTLEEVISLGGERIFAGDLPVDKNVVSYQASRGETAYFVWFSVDGHGMFSRIESYSIIGPVTLRLPGGTNSTKEPKGP